MTTDVQTLELKLVREADGLEVDLLPLQGLWTEEQYFKLTDQTNHLIEFTDGIIEVLPMPTDKHQVILALLYELLLAAIRPLGGKVLFAPLRVRIREGKHREPDILLVRDANDPRRQNAYWLGADLVVEIVSPDDRERDTKVKRADYAEAGIPEYWIVNPDDETITVLTLSDDAYREHGVFGRGSSATSVVLQGFTVDVDAVLDAS
jgi:Uma2 family endonuclease